MDITGRLDPALRHLTGARTDLSADKLPTVRAALNRRRADDAAHCDATGIDIEDSAVGAVPIRIYRGGAEGVVVYCHGGAFVLGNLDTDHRQCVALAGRAGATVISVDYRLAPEHPYPAAVEDASAVLRWAAGISDRLAVAGSSAGGALAARLAQCAADGSAPPIRFQMLHQPVLDDAPTPSKREFDDTPGFDSVAVELMWQHYLTGDRPAGERPPVGATPARTTDLTGSAPAFISCSELDPLRDEAVDYARRLMWAGVPTELHVFAGSCHGFDSLAPDWEISATLRDLQVAALRRALALS